VNNGNVYMFDIPLAAVKVITTMFPKLEMAIKAARMR
jgi:hypothetical protein